MIIYPDARDLINLVARDIPLPVDELKRILQATDSEIVLSFENVSEIVVVDDAIETRRRMRLLETLPVRYMRALPKLRCLEFVAAIDRWRERDARAVVVPTPFVPYWEETFGYPHQNVLGYRLSDVVMELLHKNPGQFRITQPDVDFLADAVKDDRSAADRERRSIDRFVGGIIAGLRRCGLRDRLEDTRAFALWVNEDPSRCPGVWFFGRVYLEYAANLRDAVERGDYMDLSHAARVPYVDALTLNRRMRNYAQQAIRRLSMQYPTVDYSSRLFSDLDEIVRRLA